MEYTPEKLYSLYHSKRLFAIKGSYPKKIVNWDNIRSRSDWQYFVKLAKLVNSNKHIHPNLYIESLAQFYKEKLSPEKLTSMKSIKIYKLFLDNKNNAEIDYNILKKELIESLENIASYCVEYNITFEQYLNENKLMIPTFLMHYESGYINISVVALLYDKLNYEKQLIEEYIDSENVKKHKEAILKNEVIRKTQQNLNKIIEKIISGKRRIIKNE